MQPSSSTLLVVDDHPMALSGTTAFLAETLPDVSVHAAAGTREALSIIQRGIRPEIILLDIWLREGTGFDALSSLRAVVPQARFVFMSAEATPDIVSKARALGASGFIGKHVDGATFAKAIREVRRGDVSFPNADSLEQARVPHDGIPVTPAELGLTPRQGSVLMLILEGLPNKSIARRLGLTENTVKEHVSAILQRLGVRTRLQIMSRLERFRVMS
jgi:DNA-binding NarL/FixJ family response regulator